jgi:hypothetical protein
VGIALEHGFGDVSSAIAAAHTERGADQVAGMEYVGVLFAVGETLVDRPSIRFRDIANRFTSIRQPEASSDPPRAPSRNNLASTTAVCK